MLRASFASASRSAWIGTAGGDIVASCFVGLEEGSARITCSRNERACRLYRRVGVRESRTIACHLLPAPPARR